jgi:hypothetical protein
MTRTWFFDSADGLDDEVVHRDAKAASLRRFIHTSCAVCMYASVSLCVCVCAMYACVRAIVYVCMLYVCMYVCMYVCVYVCMYVCM